MFVVDVRYQATVDKIDEALADHVAFLKRNYDAGTFVVSGRKIPRSGGIILARHVSRTELEKILEQDPFKQKGLAEYEITEFVASMAAGDVALLREG